MNIAAAAQLRTRRLRLSTVLWTASVGRNGASLIPLFAAPPRVGLP